MPEIGSSGLMSGDGKRGVAIGPKLPRPSSTLPLADIKHLAISFEQSLAEQYLTCGDLVGDVTDLMWEASPRGSFCRR
jgi:hypothetical protein